MTWCAPVLSRRFKDGVASSRTVAGHNFHLFKQSALRLALFVSKSEQKNRGFWSKRRNRNSWSSGSSSWCKNASRRPLRNTLSLWRRQAKTCRSSIAKDGCWPISNENAAASAVVYTAMIRWLFFCSTNTSHMAIHQRHIAFRSTTIP